MILCICSVGIRIFIIRFNLNCLRIICNSGKKKEYKIAGTLSNNENGLVLTSDFKIKLADHGIEIPTVVFAKIAEQLDIKITANYKPYKKV